MTFFPLREADEPCPMCGGKGGENHGYPVGVEPCPACHGDGTRGRWCGCHCHHGREGEMCPDEGWPGCACESCTGRIPGNPDAPKVIEVAQD